MTKFTKDPSTHPANGPLTEERLREIAALPTKTLTDGRQIAHGVISTVRTIEVVQMARQLLAGMEQEPALVVGDDGGDALAYRRLIQKFAPGTKLYAAPQLPQPAVVDADDNFYSWFCREWEQYYQPNQYSTSAKQHLGAIAESAWFACRAAMLQGAEPARQTNKLPDGCCIMPMKLTAENGAKGALSGEFSETKFINCPECLGDDECETCDGSGRIEISVPVSWTTIKEIWAKGVEHFAAAPQQEVKK